MIGENKSRIYTSPSILVKGIKNMSMNNNNKSHPFHVHDTPPRRRQENVSHRRAATVGKYDIEKINSIPKIHRKIKSGGMILNPFEDPALVGDIASTISLSHSRHTSDTSSVLSAFDPYSSHNSPNPYDKTVKTIDLPEHSVDPSKLASIAAALSEIKPQTKESIQQQPTMHKRKHSRNISNSGSLRNIVGQVFSSPSRRAINGANLDDSTQGQRQSASPTELLTMDSSVPLYTCELDPSPHQVNMPTLNFCLIVARLLQWANHVQNVLNKKGLETLTGLSPLALQQQEGPAANTLKECGIDDVQLLHAADDCMILCSDAKRLIWVVCNDANEFDASPLLDPILRNHCFFDVCFIGFRTRIPITVSIKFAQAKPEVLVSCITLSTPKSQDSLSIRHLAHSLPNYKLIRLDHISEHSSAATSSHIGHSIVLGGTTTRAYLFDKKKQNNKNVFNKLSKTKAPLESFVTSLERIAHMGLSWPKDFEGATEKGKNQLV